MFRFRKHSVQSVDSKGRIAVPKEFRRILENNKEDILILNKGFDGEILAYPLSVWEEVENELLKMPFINKKMRDYVRWRLSFAHEVRIDGQGRINIPTSLLKYAEINGEVVIAGVGDHFEIWSPQRFSKFEREFEEKLDNYLKDINEILGVYEKE